jgi:hypothetical protein
MKAKSHSAFTYVDDVIENIRQNIDTGEEVNIKPNSFMRALLDSKYDLTRSEVVDEIRTLLIAVSIFLMVPSSNLHILTFVG